MCLTVVAVRSNDSRLLVVPLVRKDMIVGTDPAQAALVNEVIIQCAFLSWHRGCSEFYFYCCHNTNFFICNSCCFWVIYTFLYISNIMATNKNEKMDAIIVTLGGIYPFFRRKSKSIKTCLFFKPLEFEGFKRRIT